MMALDTVIESKDWLSDLKKLTLQHFLNVIKNLIPIINYSGYLSNKISQVIAVNTFIFGIGKNKIIPKHSNVTI